MAFPSTRWSLLVAAAQPEHTRAAWQELARLYQPAILSFCRARFGADRAEDLTQQFLTESIEAAWWQRADPEIGSFRNYLRVLLQRFGERHGERFKMEAADPDANESETPAVLSQASKTPEQVFEAAFADVLFARAKTALLADLNDDGQRALLPWLFAEQDHGDLNRLAATLAIPANTLTQRLRRLRLRFREGLRAQLADLVSEGTNLDEELVSLIEALRR